MNVSLPLSLALAGLDPAAIGLAPSGVRAGGDRGAEVRALLAWARTRGFRAVQLNAATPGLRPRDLDRSARRDLAATLRREDLLCSGLDLWVPPEHFVDPVHVDRAVASVLLAIDLAHDLGALASGSVVSTNSSTAARAMAISLVLHERIAPDALAVIADRAHVRGLRIADHAWPPRADVALGGAGGGGGGGGGIGVGLDPAVLLARGEDPAAAAARLGSRVASARLSDAAKSSTAGLVGRVGPGSRGGGLDVLAYTVSLATTGYSGHLVLDLRGVADQLEAVQSTVAAAGVS